MAPHSYISTPVHREKRFIFETAIAAGALDTFLGIFNALKLKNLHRPMNRMRDFHNLSGQIQKTQKHPISELESGLNRLEDKFTILIKKILLCYKLGLITFFLHYKNTCTAFKTQNVITKRLSTQALSSTKVYNLYDEIKTLARTKNL
jgi:hypothetical protein